MIINAALQTPTIGDRKRNQYEKGIPPIRKPTDAPKSHKDKQGSKPARLPNA